MTTQRYRHFMYTQQLDHLPFNNIESLTKRLKLLDLAEWALIVHDQDGTAEKSIASHVHAVLKFTNGHTVTSVAKMLDDQPQYFEIWNGKINNAYGYLLHLTEGAQDKFQYPADLVIASFDFEQRIKLFKPKASNHTTLDKAMMDELLEAIMAGTVTTKEAAYEVLPGRLIGTSLTKIDAAFHAKTLLDAQQWRQQKKDSGEKLHVLWFYGRAGTAKTRFATLYASKLTDNFYRTSSNKDMFQFYNGEHVIILDDIRPENITYVELLNITDPWGSDSAVASSRYYNKQLLADTIIITSPFSPKDLYDLLFVSTKLDAFDQLARRIELTLYFEPHYIYESELTTQHMQMKYMTTGKRMVNEWSKEEMPDDADTLTFDSLSKQFDAEEHLHD